jgi:para-nitrobenzyl esterase
MPSTAIATTSGPVAGREKAGVRAFKGIVYARADRFRPAAAPARWHEPQDCFEFGAVAPQLAGANLLGDEDCLSLNVWTPARIDRPLPVLFWIHGGAFITGAGSDYDGASLAARGPAVVVTVNYRLGPLGFLQLDKLGGRFAETTNLAMTDVVAALDWVRANIAAFGGDREQITLFGQSAGASMVTTLMTLPVAKGKFSRAIAFSGPGGGIVTAAHAIEVASHFLSELGLRQSQADQLFDLPVRQLLEAAQAASGKIARKISSGTLFGPALDGRLITEIPIDRVRAGTIRGCELWLGSCRDEMTMFMRSSPPAAMIASTEARIRRDFGDAGWDKLLRIYTATARADEDPVQALLTDAMWQRPMADLAAAQTEAGGRAWVSRFDHQPALAPFTTLGPSHGADNACLWADIPDFIERPVLGRRGGPMTPADIEVTATLQAAVLRFACEGQPYRSTVWKTYDAVKRCTAVFDSPFRVVDHPDRERHQAWVEIRIPQQRVAASA